MLLPRVPLSGPLSLFGSRLATVTITLPALIAAIFRASLPAVLFDLLDALITPGSSTLTTGVGPRFTAKLLDVSVLGSLVLLMTTSVLPLLST